MLDHLSHINIEMHPKATDYTCNICKIKPLNKGSLQEHISGSKHIKNLKSCASKSMKLSQTFSCLLCNLTICDFESLIFHISKFQETHPNGKLIYKCNLCMISIQESCLKAHVRGRKHKAAISKNQLLYRMKCTNVLSLNIT